MNHMMLLPFIITSFAMVHTSTLFGNMETFLSLPSARHESFYVLQEDIFNPGSIIAALENAIVSVSQSGEMTIIAGTPGTKGYVEGSGSAALFSTVQGIYQMNETTLVVSDHGNNCLRIVDKRTGKTGLYAGQCKNGSFADGTLFEARFNSPTHIEKCQGEMIVVVEFNPGKLRTVDVSSGVVDTVFDVEGSLTHLLYIDPFTFYVVAKYGVLVLANLRLEWYSGGDAFGYVNLNRTMSEYEDLQGIVAINSKLLVVADRSNHRLRVIPKEGRVTSICTGKRNADNDDIASCGLAHPYSLMVMNGKLYIGEIGLFGGGIRSIPFAGCTTPPPVLNGVPFPQMAIYSPGDVVTYSCNHGYTRMSGEATLTCGSGLEWNGEMPACQATKCEPPPGIKHGRYSPAHSEYSVGDQVQYTCLDGYEQVQPGPKFLTCNLDKTWGEQIPKCTVALYNGPKVDL